MGNGIGAGARIGIGEESTEGTPVTVTRFLAVRQSSMNRDLALEQVEPLGNETDGIPIARDLFVAADNAGGTVDLTMAYNNEGVMGLLKHAFGTLAIGGSGPSSYTYTYTLTRAQPAAPSFTLEQLYGQGGPAAYAEVFAGCRIGKFTLDAQMAKPVVLSMDIMAQTSGGMATATSASYSTNAVMLHNHLINFTFNAVQYASITSCKLIVDKKLERTPKLGSLTSGAMLQAGIADATLEVKLRWASNVSYAAWLAQTTAAGSLTFTNGTASLVLSFAKLQVENVQKGVSGPGMQEITVPFRIMPAGSDIITAVLTNDVAP